MSRSLTGSGRVGFATASSLSTSRMEKPFRPWISRPRPTLHCVLGVEVSTTMHMNHGHRCMFAAVEPGWYFRPSSFIERYGPLKPAHLERRDFRVVPADSVERFGGDGDPLHPRPGDEPLACGCHLSDGVVRVGNHAGHELCCRKPDQVTDRVDGEFEPRLSNRPLLRR